MDRKRFNYSGLFWRQFALTAGMVLLTMLFLGLSFFSVAYSYTINSRKSEMISRAEIVASLSKDLLYNEVNGDVPESLSTLANVATRMADIKFLICDTNGRVLITTDKQLGGKEAYIPEEMVQEVLTEDGPYMERSDFNGLYGRKEAAVGVPIVKDGEKIGVVYAINDVTELVEVWRSFLVIFGFTGGVILVIAIVLAYFASSREIRPIREMVDATRAYAGGDFNVRMKTDPDYCDEINMLSQSFNQMADSLQETERQRRDFIANASHELKTPMTTIAGYTDGILDGTIPPEKEKQYLQIISDESRRLSRLVHRMLDLSQLQTMGIKEEDFDICESARIAIISLEKKITDRRQNVEIDMPDDSMICRGDQELITQVVYNLTENASKYAAPDTTIQIHIKKRDEKAVVSVENEGNCIPPDEIPLIFERFHKSDKSRSIDKDGYGLGLYVVKTIIDMHKENIMCTSQDGKTCFYFTLKLSK